MHRESEHPTPQRYNQGFWTLELQLGSDLMSHDFKSGVVF